MHYHAKTKDIVVKVEPMFLDDHSDPGNHEYVWAYHVRIENEGAEAVQLRSREWQIIDSLGHQEKVSGPGVVGEQPVIQPGKSHEYVSGVPLHTPSGMMMGTYQMENKDGELFNVDIPAFSLDSPYLKARFH